MDRGVAQAEPPRGRVGSGRIAVVLAVAALAVVLWGGYDRGWRWTGFQRNATLWDWLHLLALPVAVAIVPLWLRHRGRLDRTRYLLVAVAASLFALLVVLGYTMHLAWTGFPGNRLWDWLELLVLPVAISLLPVWSELSRAWSSRHAVVGGFVAAVLAVTIVGGYSQGWRWTGFQGNTLFDWLQLFIAPLLLPIVLVPLIADWMVADLAEPE